MRLHVPPLINELKWGEEKKAVVHFRPASSDKTSLKKAVFASLPEKAKRHLTKTGRSKVDPLVIGIDELEEYVVIKDVGDDSIQSINELPYDHVEIFWPLPLLKNGVVIIDSPGLDECESRTRITERYLSKADAILFVQSCTALGSQTEMDFIDNVLVSNGYEDMLFICNRIDQVRVNERDRITRFGREKLGCKTSLGSEAGVFFLSASEALEGRTNDNLDLIRRSGIEDLERRLFSMLVSSRGKTKLFQPIRLLTKELSLLFESIHVKRSKIQQDSQDLVYSLKEFQRHATREIFGIQKTVSRLNDDLLRIVENANSTIVYVFNNIFERCINEMVNYAPEESIGLSYFFSEKHVRKARILEVGTKIKKRIRSIFESSQISMNEFLDSNTDSINTEAEDFIALAVERITDSLHRLMSALEADVYEQVKHNAIDLASIPSLSDVGVLQKVEKINIDKLLKQVQIESNGMCSRSWSTFFRTNRVDYYSRIDTPDLDRLLQNAGFPYDDVTKDTAELKMAIVQSLVDNLVKIQDELLREHTKNYDSDVANFIDALNSRINIRIENIKKRANEKNKEMLLKQTELDQSNEIFNEIRGMKVLIEDLTYDLAIT